MFWMTISRRENTILFRKRNSPLVIATAEIRERENAGISPEIQETIAIMAK